MLSAPLGVKIANLSATPATCRQKHCGVIHNNNMTEHKGSLDSKEEAFNYPGWRVTVASGVGVFVSFGSLLVYTFGVFLKPLTEEFVWSRQAVSLAFGIAAIALAAASPPAWAIQ